MHGLFNSPTTLTGWWSQPWPSPRHDALPRWQLANVHGRVSLDPVSEHGPLSHYLETSTKPETVNLGSRLAPPFPIKGMAWKIWAAAPTGLDAAARLWGTTNYSGSRSWSSRL